jgi:hypothetical protein
MRHWRSAVAPYRRRRPLDGSEDQLRAVSLWGHDVMPLLRAAGPDGQGNGDRPLDPPRQGRSRSRASEGSLPSPRLGRALLLRVHRRREGPRFSPLDQTHQSSPSARRRGLNDTSPTRSPPSVSRSRASSRAGCHAVLSAIATVTARRDVRPHRRDDPRSPRPQATGTSRSSARLADQNTYGLAFVVTI